MEKSSEMFERFGRLLEEDKVYLDLSCTFEDICGILGADSASFGRYVMEQVGMTGDEVLEVYRSGGRGGTEVKTVLLYCFCRMILLDLQG